MKKKIISLLLAIVMVCSIIPSAFAASDEAVTAADALHELGLFNGTGTDANGKPIYDLDRAPTRAEAVTMLVRLLGKEEEAKGGNWNIPFTDVADWAKPYVGYAYANKLTSGTSATTFGGDALVTASQYITFVLRALGYNSGTDFQWDRAWELSDQIGLTDKRYHAGNTQFTRGDIAIISESALNSKEKGTNNILLDSLITSSAVDREAAKVYKSNPVRVKSIALNEIDLTMNKGDSVQLTASVLPENATDKSVVWSSSNPEIVNVSSNGLIKAKQFGTVTITATASNGLFATCNVTVKPIEVSSITLDRTKVDLVTGKSLTLKTTVKPSNADDSTVTWSSSNPSVATVTNGKVTGIKEGTATITAKAGEQTATCTVSVTAAPIVFNGSGDKVITGINVPAGSYYAEFTHNGKSNFISKLYYGEKSYDYFSISNEIGKCSGQVAFYDEGNAAIVDGYLEVEADGDWEIAIKPVSGTTTTNVKGAGEIVTGVFIATKSRVVATLTHNGKHNFIAKVIKYNGAKSYDYESLANEIGQYSGQKVVELTPGEKYYFYVHADGNWTIDLGLGDSVTTYAQPTISSASSETTSSGATSADTSTPSDSNMDGGSALANYIMSKGSTVSGTNKQIKKTYSANSGGGKMETYITHISSSDILRFATKYVYKSITAYASFDYDYNDMSASPAKIRISILTETIPVNSFDCVATFDIAKYTEGKLLSYKVDGTVIGTVPDNYSELCNATTEASIAAWEKLIYDEVGLTLADIGFSSY